LGRICYASGGAAETLYSEERGRGMETRNRTTLFRGLVVDVEQMEVKFGEKGWHLYQIVDTPGAWAFCPCTKMVRSR